MRSHRGSFLAVPLLLLVACAEREPTVPAVAETAPAWAAFLPPGSQVVEGRTGPGAKYALFFPPVWNGDLVLYARGYRDPALSPALPEVDPLPAVLLGLGYGVAYSSFSETGFAVKDGATRTHQLRGLFTSRFQSPERTYLIGHSLGGMIALMLAERNPGVYAGALPMCTFVGGSRMQMEYIFDVRVLFDYFFPGVLPGDVLNVPHGLDFENQIVPLIVGALAANPLRAVEFASVHQISLPFSDPMELATSTARALFYHTVGANDILSRTRGRSPVGNIDKVYTGSFDDAALNAGVQRFASARDAERYLDQWYEPNGRLRIPVVNLHTTGDPDTPLFHLPEYLGRVQAAGAEANLLQHVIDRYGHCSFTQEEQIQAFLALTTWVETGVRPF